jgi:hypothetical protein
VFRDERQAWVSLNIEQKKENDDNKVAVQHHDSAGTSV